MAMSDTNEWLHFYDQHNTFPSPPQLLPSSVSDATTVTVTAAPLGDINNNNNNNNNRTAGQLSLSAEGRVSKPTRRRSRASRRTPTTLLNTDTTNFRAMVQQFTGASFATLPSASASASVSGFPGMGFGFGSQSRAPAHVNPNGLMLAPNSAFQQQYMYSELVGQRASAAASVGDEGGLFMGHGHGHGGRFFTPTTTTTTTTTSSSS